MKTKCSFIIMTLAMLLCFTSSCNDDLVDNNVFCTIKGIVIDLDTGVPISQATVTLTPSGYNTYTGSDGYFEFLDLNERQYTLTVQKTGYATNRKTVTTIAGGVLDINLTLRKNN